MSEPPSKTEPPKPLAGSNELAAAVERAAEAALKRSPPSLKLGDLANNAAFHALVGWRLRKSRRHSNPLAQDFFQEILFDTMVEPEEASRGIAGYLLTYRADSFPREKRWTDSFDFSTFMLAVLAAIAGLAWLAIIMEHGLAIITAEGSLTVAFVATVAGFLVKALIEGGKESSFAARIGGGTRAIASRHSTFALVEIDTGSVLQGCGCFLAFGVGIWLAASLGYLVSLAYAEAGGAVTWAAVWGFAVPCALLVWAWRGFVQDAAEVERAHLQKSLEAWREVRHADGFPPKATS